MMTYAQWTPWDSNPQPADCWHDVAGCRSRPLCSFSKDFGVHFCPPGSAPLSGSANLDVGVTEICLKHGPQIGADLGVGFVEAGDLCDSSAAVEAVAVDVEVPAARPSRRSPRIAPAPESSGREPCRTCVNLGLGNDARRTNWMTFTRPMPGTLARDSGCPRAKSPVHEYPMTCDRPAHSGMRWAVGVGVCVEFAVSWAGPGARWSCRRRQTRRRIQCRRCGRRTGLRIRV